MAGTDYEKLIKNFRPIKALDGRVKTQFEAITRSSLSFAIVLDKTLPDGPLKKDVIHDFLKVQQMALHAITHA